MSKLILASINLSKIDRTKVQTDKNGNEWLQMSILLHDQPDQYGNDCAIAERGKKDEKRVYIGNGKYFNQNPEK